jgi:hypothetical protein
MSQAKVDRNKEARANRKKTVARQKRQHVAAIICGWVVVLAIVGWAGYSAYSAYENSRPVETIYANLDAINDYTDSLSADE